MLKRFLIIIFILVLNLFCSKNETDKNIPKLTVKDIAANAAEYVGKSTSITGTVVHVCKHGGKRMFIIGEQPEPRFKITAGKSVGAFDIELEGSDVQVTGVIQEQKVDAAFLDNWEAEISDEQKPEVGHQGHEHGASEAIDDHHENAQNQINSLRKKLKESGKEVIAFYNLECESFKEIK